MLTDNEIHNIIREIRMKTGYYYNEETGLPVHHAGKNIERWSGCASLCYGKFLEEQQ